MSLEEWYQKNFHPGLLAFLRSVLQMTEEELETEFHIWREFTAARVPEFYPGVFELLQEYPSRGGIITVVSPSEEIPAYMQRHCTYYFQTVEQFRPFLLEEENNGI